jgi:lipopolysaccharide/colanic/teichoic acid biosynthesis glycosyltransferase
VVALVSVPVLLILGLAALLILMTDGRPVMFSQIRIGERGRAFTLYKLRTMRASQAGPTVTAQFDPRITPVGALLRRLSIDELPQLWHVLRGQMTLVGPRPESEQLAKRYPQPYRSVLLARPGLTGPAQLYYRERSALPPPGWDVEAWYLTVLVPLRVRADREYLDRPTIRLTVGLLAQTALWLVGMADLQRSVAGQTAPGTAA